MFSDTVPTQVKLDKLVLFFFFLCHLLFLFTYPHSLRPSVKTRIHLSTLRVMAQKQAGVVIHLFCPTKQKLLK